MEFPDGAVGALLASSSDVNASELVPVEALVSADVGRAEHGGGGEVAGQCVLRWGPARSRR